jgi:osmotically-inducible protein OsmY
MKAAKTAKKGAKGWAVYKTAKGATKGASKAAKRKARRGPSTRERVAKIAGAVGITAAIGIVLAKIDRLKAAGRAKGAMHTAASTVTGGKDYDDATLAHKVETELFRPADVPKGSISVNVNNGVVELRGELPDQKQIDELGDSARKIAGVKDVRNLLHTGSNGG